MKIKIIFLAAVLFSLGALFSCASVKTKQAEQGISQQEEYKPFKVSAEERQIINNDAEITEL